jgi:ABC-type branched-subunit amino acid transport system substrate-binding protein
VQCSIPACEGTAQESAAALKVAGDKVPPQFVTFQLGQAITATDAQQVIKQNPDAVLIAAPGPYPQQMMTALRQAGTPGRSSTTSAASTRRPSRPSGTPSPTGPTS